MSTVAEQEPEIGVKNEVIGFRCGTRFKRHVESIARKETRNPSLVIEVALREYAERHGHEPFPPR